jgi:hypothetical protein
MAAQVPVTVMQEQEIEEVVEIGRRTSPVVQSESQYPSYQTQDYHWQSYQTQDYHWQSYQTQDYPSHWQPYQTQDYQTYQAPDRAVGVGLGLQRSNQVCRTVPHRSAQSLWASCGPYGSAASASSLLSFSK